MLINTVLDSEDFVHLYYTEEDEPSRRGCSAGARMANRINMRPLTPEFFEEEPVRITSEEIAFEVARTASQAEVGTSPRARSQRRRREHARRRASAMEASPEPRRDTAPEPPYHTDDPAMQTPFAPIAGEYVQYLGRSGNGGVLAMSNYRFHHQESRRDARGVSVPLRLIEFLEIKDIVYLHIMCKDGRSLRVTFGSGEQCAEWSRRLTNITQPPPAINTLFASTYAARLNNSGDGERTAVISRTPDYFRKEVERLEFTANGAWRISSVNSDYALCPSYPPLLVVPASIGDEDLTAVAKFRAARRVPSVVWRHRGNGAVIARSSQPEVGWLGWRSPEDERLLAAFMTACAHDAGRDTHNDTKPKLLIVDARSYASAVTNRARGGGCECQQYYPHTDIQFMCLPNIHHVRRSFHALRQLVADPTDQTNFHGGLERSMWLQYIGGLVRAGVLVARAVHSAARPVLVHCSDGWDRTPQIVATAQLLLDPYYRTVKGFQVLIQREWLDFGHKFADRCGHNVGLDEPNERSPIFIQWLDLVHQIMLQYPCSFEFSQAYLIKLVTHAHSCLFGTFLCNNSRERAEARLKETTESVWTLLDAPMYRNHLFVAPQGDQVLWPDHNVRSMAFWAELYLGERLRDTDSEPGDDVATDTATDLVPTDLANGGSDEDDDDVGPVENKTAAEVVVNGNAGPCTNGTMTKTRSYENLLNEGAGAASGHRALQRRCSHPSLAPDVAAKLSNLSIVDSAAPLPCRKGLQACPPISPHSNMVDSFFDVDGKQNGVLNGNGTVSNDDDSESTSTYSDRPAISYPNGHTLIDLGDQVDGLTENSSESGSGSVKCVYGTQSNSSSLERELAKESVTYDRMVQSDSALMSESAIMVNAEFGSGLKGAHSDLLATSPGSDVFIDNVHFGDVTVLSEMTRLQARDRRRLRNDSIGWPSLSESSQHTDSSADSVATDRGSCGRGVHSAAAVLLEAELGNLMCEESQYEGVCPPRASHRHARVAAVSSSQATLCPNSPQRPAESAVSGTQRRPLGCCAKCCSCCCRRKSSLTGSCETSTDTLVEAEGCCCGPGLSSKPVDCKTSSLMCSCGGSSNSVTRDPIDGLPCPLSPVQTRLHQIILEQQIRVCELSRELSAAREALHARSRAPPPPPPPPPPPAHTSPNHETSDEQSLCGAVCEVGEECAALADMPGSVLWVPDHAVSRCQACHNQFWLGRRKHHCRSCGRIFCADCSERSAVLPAERLFAPVRVCRECFARLAGRPITHNTPIHRCSTESQMNGAEVEKAEDWVNSTNGGASTEGAVHCSA